MQAYMVWSFLALAIGTQAAAPAAAALLERYVQALGGEAALRAVRTRITEGQFDNGRGLNTRFRVYEEAPNKRVTLIGAESIERDAGSGRGFDGTTGWDKNFIGTGLRTVEGRELAGLLRDADLLRPLHLLDDCASTSVETAADQSIAVCQTADGRNMRLHFDRRTGLLIKQEAAASNGQPAITVSFEDYRVVDGVHIPFRTRVLLPGATVMYATESVRHNQSVDKRVFQRPRSNDDR